MTDRKDTRTGKKEMTEDKEKYQLAHKYCYSNEEDIKNSKECGCFFCIKIFSPEKINEWIPDSHARTALYPYCGIDSVLPDSRIKFDIDFLEGMYKLWFE